MSTKLKSISLLISILLIPSIFIISVNIYARNFKTDSNLPLPMIVRENNTIKASNCTIAVQAELELLSFNGLPNGYNFENNGQPTTEDLKNGEPFKYDKQTYVLKDSKNIYNVFCATNEVDFKVSKNYVEFNKKTGETQVKEIDILKKLILKNY